MSKMAKPHGAYVGTEEAFQVSAIGFVRRMVRANGLPPECAMHVPNGGQRSAVAGAKMKAAGVVRGYPDIMVFAYGSINPNTTQWSARHCGLAFELKIWPNKPTMNQLQVHDILRAAGWCVATCWSLDAVISTCEEYLNRRP